MKGEQFKKRIGALKRSLSTWGVEALLISSPPNVFYLTGLKASLAFVLILEEGEFLLTDARYFEKARKVAPPEMKLELITDDSNSFLKRTIASLKIKRVGFESDKVSCDTYRSLKSSKYSLLGISHPLQKLRMIKDNEERATMKKAIEITDKIYYELLNNLDNQSELTLRGKIIDLAFKFSAQGEAFSSIVALGENSAIPHWESSKVVIEKGKPLLLDFGVIYGGYCSDFTRTLYLGKPPSDFKKYYEYVKSAWFKGFEKVKVGTPVWEIDKTIREYFHEKGVLSRFTHSTGHGIGIEVHEFPRIYFKRRASFLKKQPLIEEGMVFTIEPGLYFEGRFGIRLENIVFVEGGEGRTYSKVPMELLSL
ncbi:MAG: Xaa-Pro peptidase family protein [Caldimicrobium sp.]|nr:Xaa-Pro peptidase family protein [Caldimicrobium sp.]MCX7613460.1 Xaa-Pro peptidase family protein [Caldimicrobium sp.]MDW8182968.1 Xaa-Pro peptidase family protein [Caldimicrobium sp.]